MAGEVEFSGQESPGLPIWERRAPGLSTLIGTYIWGNQQQSLRDISLVQGKPTPAHAVWSTRLLCAPERAQVTKEFVLKHPVKPS